MMSFFPLPHDGVLTWKFELARNTHGPIAAVSEDFDMAYSTHRQPMPKHMPNPYQLSMVRQEMCQEAKIGTNR